MASKTKFAITVTFDSSVPVKLSPLKTIQKGADPGKVGVSVTDCECTNKPIQLSWTEETDPIAKTVKLALKEVRVEIIVKCSIQYAKEIDRKSPCYAHIVKHEYMHLTSRKNSVKKYRAVMIKWIEQAAAPTIDNPETVKLSKAKALRAASYKKIETAVKEARGKFMTASNTASKKIDSTSENNKTTALCAEYI
ncbi:MAG: hypothetical protein AAFR45_12755 [Pseudomonadota bacterium]